MNHLNLTEITIIMFTLISIITMLLIVAINPKLFIVGIVEKKTKRAYTSEEENKLYQFQTLNKR